MPLAKARKSSQRLKSPSAANCDLANWKSRRRRYTATELWRNSPRRLASRSARLIVTEPCIGHGRENWPGANIYLICGLATHPDRAEIIKSAPNLMKQEAHRLMRELK